jgi:sugar lactone lactonase YvrE
MGRKPNLHIFSVTPPVGMPGGELIVRCQGFVPGLDSKVFLGEEEAFILSASEDQVRVRLPESPKSLGLMLQVGRKASHIFPFSLATQLATGLHPVANPVVTADGSILTTISGERGQEVIQPLIKISQSGEKVSFHCEIMNPTGLTFSRDGQLYITSRHDGMVFCYRDYDQLEVVAEDLGIPCGIIFDSKGFLYVGDRSGRIFRIDSSGNKEKFAVLEPSISAYHLAIDSTDCLYVTGPTFAMRDRLYRISQQGKVSVILDGLARPQGLAFLPEGDLLIATGYQGKKGIFRYSPSDGSLKHYLTAPILVGIAVAEQNIYLASNDSIYRAPLPGSAAVN